MKYPSDYMREIGQLACCIRAAWQTILDHITPITVQEDHVEYNAGADSHPAGWISVTLINQGDTNVTLTSGSGGVLLPGTSIEYDLKDFANRGDQIDFTVAAPGAGEVASLIIAEVR